MIERVCVVGAGVIGSLYAGHLARVADVSCLVRRDEHARSLNDHGLRVSGRHHFVGHVAAATDPAEQPQKLADLRDAGVIPPEDPSGRSREPS